MSNVEFEAKILGIELSAIRDTLNKIGAKKVDDYTYARYVFDTIPRTSGRWLRLRTDGKRTSLTVKEISDNSITGTSEWETSVGDFDTTLEIIKRIGLAPKGYQENKRELYTLDDVEISIDTWPHLEPYVEIEGKNEVSVENVAKMLGFTGADLDTRNTKALYAEKGINLDNVAELRFKQGI